MGPVRGQYEVRWLGPGETEHAAMLCARAFRDQPTAMPISDDPSVRLRWLYRMFRGVLPIYCPTIVGAWRGAELAGLLGVQEDGSCRVDLQLVARVLPRSFLWGTPRGVLPLLVSMLARERHDLPEPHIHLEPCAVDPLAKSEGVAAALFDFVVTYADSRRLPLFGTGDKQSNETYFVRYGFEVVAEFYAAGVTHLSMKRPVPAL
jgi:GNAT superfamily N-acetyltransferase